MRILSFSALQAFGAKHGYPIMLLLFLVWMCVGVFPLHCYESDSMHTIAGCSVLYNQGFTIPPVYSYEYNMQPLIYYVVLVFQYILPFLSCEEIFCLLTWLVAMLNIVVTIRFMWRLTGIRREILLFALFLLPESVAIGMYPNTAIFAMLPFVLAMNCLLDRKLPFATLWMCIAPLFRIDILMVYPVILFVFLWQKDSWLVAFKKSALVAVIVVAFISLCYWGLQANPFGSTLNAYGQWNEKISLAQNFYALFTFYTALGGVLFLGGLLRIIKLKDYQLLLLIVVPVALNHIVYARMGCATKHYLYILPFVAMCIAFCLSFLHTWVRNRNGLKWCVRVGIAGYLVLSVRFSVPSRPWRNMPDAETQTGPFLTLWTGNVLGMKASLGIGAGFSLRTADERMLATGNLFYPFYIHQLKANRAEARFNAYQLLNKQGDYALFKGSWEEMIYIPLLLQSDGYSLERGKEDDLFCFVLESPSKERKVMVLKSEADLGGTESELERMLREALSDLPSMDIPCYFFTFTDSFIYFFDKFASEGIVEKLSKGFYRINIQQKESL